MELLIDIDSAIYKAGCANETREYLVQDKRTGSVLDSFQYKKQALEFIDDDPELEACFTKQAGPVAHSLQNCKGIIEGILDNIPVRYKRSRLYISGKGNFRYDVYPEYKANRDPSSRPIHEQELREYLVRAWHATPCDGEEADDVVSYMQCGAGVSDSTCIVGIDKDLWNTPGMHWNYDKQDVLEFITEDEANLRFWRQMLTGDSSDGIPGLPKYGKGKALKILPEYSSDIKDVVHREYITQGFDEQYFLTMGRLLWMRREPNQLWTPELCEISYGF